jgi:NAD(P)-dependent dehydrogenase (short-subunit alcohol dehydrogenase family)
MENLKNKVAVVTGGSSGIGRAICLALSDAGCKIAVLSRHRASKEGEEATDTLVKEGIWVYCDISKPPLSSKKGGNSGSLADAMQTVVEKYGKIDILVNNAGFIGLKDFLELTEEDYDSVLDTNLKGSVFATQLALKQMLFRQSPPGGQIINISSLWGLLPSLAPIYGASKAALINFTQNMAAYFGDRIRCNCICPGYIDTNPPSPDQVGSLARQRPREDEIPIKRVGKPGELAEVVVWVLRSSYMNGATVLVDGGRNALISTGLNFDDYYRSV